MQPHKHSNFYMINFKQETICSIEKNRIDQVIISEQEDKNQKNGLIIKTSPLSLENSNMDLSKEYLHSSDEEKIKEALDNITWLSYFPGNIEQLTDDDIERFFFLAEKREYKNQKININECALKSIYFILVNSNFFTKFNFCPLIVHQLPSIYVPLILSYIFEYNPSYANSLISELDYLMVLFDEYFKYNEISIYSIIQVIAFLFRYDVLSNEPATKIIQKFKCCSCRGEFDQNPIKFFLYDFFRNIKKAEFLKILAETDFFKYTTKNFTLISTQSKQMESFYEMLRKQDIGELILNSRGMVTVFDAESLRNFILETNLNLIENGFIDKFIDMCFPDLFDSASSFIIKGDYQDRLIKLRYLVSIAKHIIPYSQELRTHLIYSIFNSSLLELESFNEKVLILIYLSFFVPFGVELMTNLDKQFKITEMCYDIMFGEDLFGILAAINILLLVLNNKIPNYQNQPFILEMRTMLTDQQILEVLEHLSQDCENEEIRFKSNSLVEFVVNSF